MPPRRVWPTRAVSPTRPIPKPIPKVSPIPKKASPPLTAKKGPPPPPKPPARRGSEPPRKPPQLKAAFERADPAFTSTLPPFKGKSPRQVERILQAKGFEKVKDTGRNAKYRWHDGSQARVDRYGDKQAGVYKPGNNSHAHKEGRVPAGGSPKDRPTFDDQGRVSTDPRKTHIGLKNPGDFEAVRGRGPNDISSRKAFNKQNPKKAVNSTGNAEKGKRPPKLGGG